MDEELYRRMQQQMKDGFMRAIRGWYRQWQLTKACLGSDGEARDFLYNVLDGCKDFPAPLNGWVLEALGLA